MSDYMKEMERLIDEHDPIPECDCKRCAITERDRLRAALLAHAAQRDHIEDVLGMVQSVELPEPDQVIGHGWDARSYYGADQMRTYGDAREAAGYARGRKEAGKLREALEKLARLGNGDSYGNSVGNQIAIAALAEETNDFRCSGNR